MANGQQPIWPLPHPGALDVIHPPPSGVGNTLPDQGNPPAGPPPDSPLETFTAPTPLHVHPKLFERDVNNPIMFCVPIVLKERGRLAGIFRVRPKPSKKKPCYAPCAIIHNVPSKCRKYTLCSQIPPPNRSNNHFFHPNTTPSLLLIYTTHHVPTCTCLPPLTIQPHMPSSCNFPHRSPNNPSPTIGGIPLHSGVSAWLWYSDLAHEV